MPGRFGKGFGRFRSGHGGRGRRRMGMRPGRPGNLPEFCICPQCGATLPHQVEVPCYKTPCPQCGSAMTRQFNLSGVPGLTPPGEITPKPVVDQNLCDGCQKCAKVCPSHAIEMQNDKALILAEKCTNCGLCIPVCPVSAIK